MNNFAITHNKPALDSSKPDQSVLSRSVLSLLRGYRLLRGERIAPCRFHPSCSNYASEAIEVHGGLRGSALAIRRVLRCRPLGPHGIDLVPEPKKARSSR